MSLSTSLALLGLTFAALASAAPQAPTAPKVVLQTDHQGGVDIAAWTPDNKFLLTAAVADSSFIIWDIKKAVIVDHLRLPTPTSKDGDYIDGLVSLTVSRDRKFARLVAQVEPIDTRGRYTQDFTLDLQTRLWSPGKIGPFSKVDRSAKGKAKFPNSPDSKLLLKAGGTGLLIAANTPHPDSITTLIGDSAGVDISVSISPDGRLLAILGWAGAADDTVVDVLDLTTGRFLPQHKALGQYWVVRWIDNARYLLSETPDFYVPRADDSDPAPAVKPALLVNAEDARIVAEYSPRCGASPVGDNGAMLGVGLGRCVLREKDGGLWLAPPPPTDKSIAKPAWRRFSPPALTGRLIQAAAAAPDGKDVAVVSSSGKGGTVAQKVEVIDLASGRRTSQMALHPASRIGGLRWSDDGQYLLLLGNYIEVWRPGAATLDANIEYGLPNLAATDGKMVLVGSIVQKSILTHRIGSKGDWVPLGGLSASAGGFLADKHIYWTASFEGGVRFYDERTDRKLLTLFIFEGGKFFALDPRGRYDTNLGADSNKLRWLVNDDPWRSLAPQTFIRNYFEPGLIARTLDCSADDSCAGKFREPPPVAELNRTLPTIEIVDVTSSKTDGTADVTLIVRQTSDPDAANHKTQSGAYDLRLFRDKHLVAEYPAPKTVAKSTIADWRAAAQLIAPGDATPVRLTATVPVPSGSAGVGFSAYAFNEDRVKGETTSLDFASERPISRPKRAYLITIGIDAYEEQAWRLHFAAGDAVALSRSLSTIDGYEVVPVRVVASGQAKIASHAQLRALFALLAGHEEERANLLSAGIDVSGVQAATPDDAVVISFAGHGYTDAAGDFFLVPQDARIGSDGLPDLSTLVSSAELTNWLRPVDAGEMAMIIDACHSAASVQTADFKPAPLGDPGLGQLAFDKGIRILAATQGDDVAMESATLHHGLLTYALAEEGLAAGKADLDRDGAITLDELMRYAAARLPGLSIGTASSHSNATFARTLILDPSSAAMPPHRQQPSLFDFTGAASRLVVRKVAATPASTGRNGS